MAIQWIGGNVSPQDAEELLRLFPNCTSINLTRAELDKAIKENPTNAFFLASLGEMQQKENKLAEAEATLLKAIAIEPKSAYAFYTYGVMLAESTRFDEAKEMFSKAVELKPKFAAALRGLGYVAQKQAESIFEKATQLNPKYDTNMLKLVSVSLKETPPSEVGSIYPSMNNYFRTYPYMFDPHRLFNDVIFDEFNLY
jgi:Tfp pilus assembly protein PilF